MKLSFSVNKFINEKSKNLITIEALDLLYKMLEVDHSLRITAKDALEHPYLKICENKIDKKKRILIKNQNLKINLIFSFYYYSKIFLN